MNEFEKWYKENEPFYVWNDNISAAWQAATAVSDKCVRELTATIAELQATNHELSTSINVLREALEAECGGRCNAEYNPCNANRALASTPAQSLLQHDNEVIERCAKVAMDWDITGIAIADAICELKGK